MHKQKSKLNQPVNYFITEPINKLYVRKKYSRIICPINYLTPKIFSLLLFMTTKIIKPYIQFLKID